MAIYNVCHSVVELVEAEDGRAAIMKLRAHLSKLGLEPFESNLHPANAFASEPLTPDTEREVLR